MRIMRSIIIKRTVRYRKYKLDDKRSLNKLYNIFAAYLPRINFRKQNCNDKAYVEELFILTFTTLNINNKKNT